MPINMLYCLAKRVVRAHSRCRNNTTALGELVPVPLSGSTQQHVEQVGSVAGVYDEVIWSLIARL